MVIDISYPISRTGPCYMRYPVAPSLTLVQPQNTMSKQRIANHVPKDITCVIYIKALHQATGLSPRRLLLGSFLQPFRNMLQPLQDRPGIYITRMRRLHHVDNNSSLLL